MPAFTLATPGARVLAWPAWATPLQSATLARVSNTLIRSLIGGVEVPRGRARRPQFYRCGWRGDPRVSRSMAPPGQKSSRLTGGVASSTTSRCPWRSERGWRARARTPSQTAPRPRLQSAKVCGTRAGCAYLSSSFLCRISLLLHEGAGHGRYKLRFREEAQLMKFAQ